MAMAKKARFVVVGITAIVALVSWASAQNAAVDPQTLVGQWVGNWANRGAARGGRYYLTIEKVEGDKVYLRIERPDLKDSSQPKDVEGVGTLTGNHLSYAPPRIAQTDLTIDGNKMSGTSQGRATLEIELLKK